VCSWEHLNSGTQLNYTRVDAEIILSKIQPPRPRPGLIPRARIDEPLADALALRKLTILCAPAGFGKTAALTRQIERLPAGTALAWIAADESDDLHRFLHSLVAALEPFDPPWRSEPEALIAVAVDERADRRAAAAGLVNALTATGVPRGIIVLDDAHCIADPAVFDFLGLVLERLPQHWGLVIASRVEPPLALARLRARDELAEFRQSDLSFTHEEVQALIGAGGGPDAGQLLARTGGWPAGLRLALNAHQRGRTSIARSMDRDVFDFLASEVLDDMPTALREFVLRSSVMPQLSASRCRAVTGDERAAQWLVEIERRGLFVSVQEGAEPVLTLHDLIREFLEERLRRDRPELVPGLLRRAAQSEPDAVRRMHYLLRAGDLDAAEHALEEAAEPLLADSAAEPVLHLIQQFPAERQRDSPILQMLRGEWAWERWEWRAMADAMRRAAAGFKAASDDRRLCRTQVLEAAALVGGGWFPESRARLSEIDFESADCETRALAQALRTWHHVDSGEFADVAAGYSAALDVLEQTDRLRTWGHCFQRVLYVWFPGMGPVISRLVDGVMRRSGDRATQVRAIAHVKSAWQSLWRGDLAQAIERLDQAEDDARWLGHPVRVSMFLNVARALVHAVRGEREPALAALDAALRCFTTFAPSGPLQQPTSMKGHYHFLAVRLADTLGDATLLREQAALIPPAREIKNLVMIRAPLATVPARLAAADGRHAEAAAIWERLLKEEGKLDVLGLAEETRLRHADALLRLGKRAEAGEVLKPLLARVSESGELGGVLLAGSAVIARVAGAAWRDELEWTELAMLRGWAQRYAGPVAPAQPASVVAGPLTARELDVLGRIAAGESNKLIARALDLSPHTVKRHVANILEKLDISSRGQAAEWYRANRTMAR
jgi:LuxR family maltose regulon positive regulatory protein